MTRSPRFLAGLNSSSSSETTAAAEPPEAVAVESDFVVILAAMLCALICVVGLIAVARCAWLRRNATTASAASNKGLKKKVLQSLPKFTYDSEAKLEAAAAAAECAICLAEYANGDEIRVLPQCGHGFHVACIDTWLGSHSSCPSCRKMLVVARCRKCGDIPAVSGGTPSTEAELNTRGNAVSSSGFLPF